MDTQPRTLTHTNARTRKHICTHMHIYRSLSSKHTNTQKYTKTPTLMYGQTPYQYMRMYFNHADSIFTDEHLFTPLYLNTHTLLIKRSTGSQNVASRARRLTRTKRGTRAKSAYLSLYVCACVLVFIKSLMPSYPPAVLDCLCFSKKGNLFSCCSDNVQFF